MSHFYTNLRSALLIVLLLVFTGYVSPIYATNFDTDTQTFQYQTDNGTYVIQFYSEHIIEVNFYPKGTTPDDYHASHAVVMKPEMVAIKIRDLHFSEMIYTNGIGVMFDSESQKLSFFYKGEPLLAENDGFVLNDENDGFSVDFSITESETLMGGGSRALGMNRRGNRLELYNKAHYGYEYRSELKNFTLPIVMSSNKYMLHFDNPTTGFLDLDSGMDQTITYEAFSGRKTYHVIAGDSWFDIVRSYTQLTGFQPLPPLWAFGNFASRFGYRTQDEVMETIALFREKEVPVDAVIIDLYWFGPDIQGHMGNLAFDEENWPDPKTMVEELEKQGVKTVLITEPFVLTTSSRWNEVTAIEGIVATDSLGNPGTYDFYFGNTGLIDVFHPNGINWFWGIYQELKENYGIHGWWGDLGEPEVHPDWLQHYIGSAREVHNIYGHQWAKLLSDGYDTHYPNERLFNLMRAGYSGSQRYGMIPWTGDVSRHWGGLRPQPELSLQMGMQGLGYLHSDLGGFAWPHENPELYVRWMQYGVFQPVYRPHAQDDVPSEPVFWDDETLRLSKKAIELRYQLLPYIYTAAFQNSVSGVPFMRPLFFEEPDNFKYYHISETYLFGDDFLVAPVLREAEQFVQLHTPKTANWFDFYTGTKYDGGSVHQVPVQQEYTPVFVRGGAIIPIADLVQTTDDYSVEHLTLHYFHDTVSAPYETYIYHDDGLTKDAHKKGVYEKLHVRRESAIGNVKIQFERETGELSGSKFSEITLVMRNITKAPRSIMVDGRRVQFRYDAESQTVQTERFMIGDSQSEVRVRL